MIQNPVGNVSLPRLARTMSFSPVQGLILRASDLGNEFCTWEKTHRQAVPVAVVRAVCVVVLLMSLPPGTRLIWQADDQGNEFCAWEKTHFAVCSPLRAVYGVVLLAEEASFSRAASSCAFVVMVRVGVVLSAAGSISGVLPALAAAPITV